MKRAIRFLVLVCLVSVQTQADTIRVILRWSPVATYTDATPVKTFVSYNVYRSQKPDGSDFRRLNTGAITFTLYIDGTARHGQIYYYAVAAVDWKLKREGLKSNLLEVNVP